MRDAPRDFVDDVLSPGKPGTANTSLAGRAVVTEPCRTSAELELAEREYLLRGFFPTPFFEDDNVQEPLTPFEIAMVEAHGFTADEWQALQASPEGRMAFITARAEIAAGLLSEEIEAGKWKKAGLYPATEGTPQ